MSSPYLKNVMPKAGQIWKAPSKKTKSGFRFVQIRRVYRPSLALHTCVVREVSKTGRDLRPDHVHDGVEVSNSFDHSCDSDGTFGFPFEYVRG
jgi:hypothetical protein